MTQNVEVHARSIGLSKRFDQDVNHEGKLLQSVVNKSCMILQRSRNKVKLQLFFKGLTMPTEQTEAMRKSKMYKGLSISCKHLNDYILK